MPLYIVKYQNRYLLAGQVLAKSNEACFEGHRNRLHFFILEFCVLWCTWEWNHVADILHTGYEENQTLETETETCVWA